MLRIKEKFYILLQVYPNYAHFILVVNVGHDKQGMKTEFNKDLRSRGFRAQLPCGPLENHELCIHLLVSLMEWGCVRPWILYTENQDSTYTKKELIYIVGKYRVFKKR